jgi:5'-3' exonuclease
MPGGPQRLLLLDGHSLAYRAFFALPVENFSTSTGQPTNAVYGFTSMLINLLRDEAPTHLAVAFDVSRHTFRTDEYADYKANRSSTPDEFKGQVSLIHEVLDALRITVVEKDGYEADDVIGTVATRSTRPVDVVTGDRDLFQLVDDARGVRVLYTARGVGRHDVVDEAWVAAKYGIPGTAYADFATLRGDPSDGLPGVAGIGEKTAASLVTKYGSLAAILAALDAGDTGMPAGARTKLAAARAYLELAPVVVAVATDVPVPVLRDEARIPAKPHDPERLLELSERWGLDSSLNRVLTAFGTVTG